MSNLINTVPTSIGWARELCHLAIQWPSCAIRASLVHQADDSHSNLGWIKEHSALVKRPLDADEQYQPGFCFVDLPEAVTPTFWHQDGFSPRRTGISPERLGYAGVIADHDGGGT
ncbi:MAG: hypothetical protein ACNYPE_00730 [Candidatus Azotimanducaceae bacterium WSBS_2022_MAG_OTU7]